VTEKLFLSNSYGFYQATRRTWDLPTDFGVTDGF